MSAESLLPWWRPGGPHPPTQDLRDIVMVAGHDPYAYKGIEDVNRPYVRRETAPAGLRRNTATRVIASPRPRSVPTRSRR